MLKHEGRCAEILDQARTTVNVEDDRCKLGGQWKRFVEAHNLY